LADRCNIEEGGGAFEWEEDDGDESNLYLEEHSEWDVYTSRRKWSSNQWEQKTPDANADFGGPAR
jgi:hypothetical protein